MTARGFNGHLSAKGAAIVFLLFFSCAALAQDGPRSAINEIISAANAYSAKRSVEKLYIQTDKPYYFAGDTLWFKSYLFDASYLSESLKSGLLYVEIVSDSNKVVKRVMLPLTGGVGYGQIALDEKEMPQGGYVLRAYTRWMLNFGEDYIFKKPFYIVKASDNDWLVKYHVRTVRDSVFLGLQLNRADKAAVALREMQVRIAEGKKLLFRKNADTGLDGTLMLAFNLSQAAKAENLSVHLLDLRKGEGNRRLAFPLRINRPEWIDLQFLPEGGAMLAGQPSRVAFKALNEDGLAAAVEGVVYDSQMKTMAVFKSEHLGMGSFDLVPRAGETYTAKVKLPDGSFKAYPLPAVRRSGITLSVENPLHGDSCVVTVRAAGDVATGRQMFLIGQSRGLASYGASFILKETPVVVRIAKSVFPEGIARFTLMGPDRAVLNERIVFVDHHDRLKIEMGLNKTEYARRDSVRLRVKVSDRDGNPVQGRFSLSVTDDGQVATDSVKASSIVTSMLLTSDLKGNVEQPGYYQERGMDMNRWRHLDLLLLTQGWTGYDWPSVFKPAAPFSHPAEQEFLVKGRVTNLFNKPVAGSGMTLFSRKPLMVQDTVTNDQGDFTFRNVFPADSAVFFIQAKNRKGKSFNVGVEVDEFTPPVLAPPAYRTEPWYVNLDTARFGRVNRAVRLKKDLTRLTGANVLKEVVVKGKKIIRDSKNLNGPGGADIVIDEKVLEKAGRTTLGDLLYQHVRGFGFSADKTGALNYYVNRMLVHLVIDGVNTEFFLPEGTSLFQFYKEYFDYFDAEEIKGIEVMSSSRYESSYRVKFLGPLVEPWKHAFIEVTTRGGKGPFMRKSIGTYLYRPLPFTLPAAFYSPRYTVPAKPDMTDIRSTVFWAPDITTDQHGEAVIDFYTSDNAGSYSVILEGSDMQGKVGTARTKINVAK